MNDTTKPFVCTTEGCKMTFTNEDHLNVHQKKHYMVLNLGLGNKNNIFVADQTPTPTRFIRNCEEVGLFQDLQHVNPFDETFRHAVESGITRVHEISTDDMLHTPHILPHEENATSPKVLQQNATKFVLNEIDSDLITMNKRKTSQGNVIDLTDDRNANANQKRNVYGTILDDDDDDDVDKIQTESKKCKPTIRVVTKTNKSSVKKKLKETLLKNKQQQRESNVLDSMQTAFALKPIIIEALSLNKTATNNNTVTIINSSANYQEINDATRNKKPDRKHLTLSVNQNVKMSSGENDEKITIIRERNRAAAMRCRIRKKSWIERLHNENNALAEKNNELSKENQNLKKEIIYLKMLLLQHKDCPVTQPVVLGVEMEKLANEKLPQTGDVNRLPTAAPKYRQIKPNENTIQILPKVLPPNTYIVSKLNTSSITVIK